MSYIPSTVGLDPYYCVELNSPEVCEAMDLSDPATLARVVNIRNSGETETPQGDVLRSPDLYTAQLEDTHTGILLPPVRLGNRSNLMGQSGYDRLKTIEYLIHFELPDKARQRLVSLCWMCLREAFNNNGEKMRPFITRAYENCPTDSADDAFEAFKSMARMPWDDDGSFMIKERTTVQKRHQPCVRSAEGVDHTGNMAVPVGSIVRIDVRLVSWAFKEMYGVSMKLSFGGITVLKTANRHARIRTAFLPGNYYLCVTRDEANRYEIRDAEGHPMLIKIPFRLHAASEPALVVDAQFADSVVEMEHKTGCALTCLHDDESCKFMHVRDLGTEPDPNDHSIFITPKISNNKSMKQLYWQRVPPP